MGQLQLSHPIVLLPNVPRLLEMDERVARFVEGEETVNPQAKPNRQGSATQTSLQLIAERLERINANDPLSSDASQRGARMPARADVRAQVVDMSATQSVAGRTARTSAITASSWTRTFLTLILVALPLCLTLAIVLWLGGMDAPWPRSGTLPPRENPMPTAQPRIPPPVLSAPATLEAKVGEDVTLPIALEGTDKAPPGSIIVINGLPQGSSLSSGRSYGPKGWILKTGEIGDLHLDLPNTVGGAARLAIQLVAPDGGIIADTATVFMMKADPEPSIGVHGRSASAEAQELDERSQREALGTGEPLTNLEAANAMSGDLVPLPTRRPKKAANNHVRASWIRPFVFVNLREAPSSSAQVVGVIAKGAKLRIEGRKRGWIQVTNPATSQGGWIYSGNVATVR